MWYIHSSVIKERTKKHFYQSSNKTARLKCTCNLSNPYGRNSRYPHAFQNKSSERGGGRLSRQVSPSLADKSIQQRGPIFSCARLKNWLYRHCQSRAADIKAITETSLMWFSRRAEQPLRCISATSVTLACFARARLKFIVLENWNEQKQKKKRKE